jgi:hypothetical protein
MIIGLFNNAILAGEVIKDGAAIVRRFDLRSALPALERG